VEASQPLGDAERGALGRFELAADARIASALSRAQDVYLGWVRGSASLCAIALGIAAALILGSDLVDGVIVGIVAVPLAPIANDVVAALQAATRAMRGS
jgi:TRAP-type C4-dicarboxylate transport system permease large subunit